jgi:hypothetical protein
VFTSEPFEVSDDADSVQMLTRSSQIGEFYIMMPPQVKPTGGDGSNLHTADMMIYDEESDKHVRVTWREALKATLAGSLGNPGVSTGHGLNMPLNQWAEKAEAIAKYSSGKDENGADVAAPGWETLDLNIRLVVARPFIEHLMVRHSPIGHTRARLTLSLRLALRSTTSSSRSRGARRALPSSARRTVSHA